MNNLDTLKASLNEERRKVFDTLHGLITSVDKSVTCRVFPIYISYSLGEKTIALIYYKNRAKDMGAFDIGLNIDDMPRSAIEFIDASYMQYPGIKYSTKVQSLADVNPELRKIIKSTKK